MYTSVPILECLAFGSFRLWRYIYSFCVGAGKTSLIDCLAGRRRFDSGNVMLNSFTLDKELRRNIAYVQQSDIFLSELTAWDTIWVGRIMTHLI